MRLSTNYASLHLTLSIEKIDSLLNETKLMSYKAFNNVLSLSLQLLSTEHHLEVPSLKKLILAIFD